MSNIKTISFKSLPFTCEDFDLQDTFQYTFYNCRFTRDFGPFKSDDFVDMIDLELDNGILKCHGTATGDFVDISLKLFNIVLSLDN